MSAKIRLLIDGDHIVYKAAAAVEKVVDWGDDISSVFADKGSASEIVEHHVEQLCEQFGTQDYVFTVSSGKKCFRNDIYPQYKHNRKGTRRPIILGWLRKWTEDHLDGKAIDNIEADDVCGILATHPKYRKYRQIIVTEDKDLLTIPGSEIYIHRDDWHLKMSPEEAQEAFVKQILTGDAADGFPGCPGVGPVKAHQIYKSIEDMNDWWSPVVAAYEKAGLAEEDALTQARLAYILQYKNYDIKKREVKLWEPK